MNRKEIVLGLDVVFAILRRDYRNDEGTLSRAEDEMRSYFDSCFPLIHEPDCAVAINARHDCNCKSGKSRITPEKEQTPMEIYVAFYLDNDGEAYGRAPFCSIRCRAEMPENKHIKYGVEDGPSCRGEVCEACGKELK